MLRVVSVATEPNYHLTLHFTNGEVRSFDMRPYLHYTVFKPLHNQHVFDLAQVDYVTVVWPGEIDIAPETLYERSVPISNKKSVRSVHAEGA